MRSTWFSRAARAFTALTLLSATTAATLAAGPGPERPGRRRAANLFAVTNAVINVNRVFCGINNLGELCVDPTNSPVLGGGFWPKGTPDQYIFNSGLQLAGTIPSSAGGGRAVFPWAGDTVGAYFFDARGTQVQGDPRTLVFNTLDAGDAAAWPVGAYVRDTNIYHPVLVQQAALGLIGISQQDLWVRAWDGNPAFLSGRTHPMGILVEERAMGWNYPTGNEDIVYFVFTFYNVTAKVTGVYDNLDAAIKGQIAATGIEFQSRNEAVFNVDIPDSGYTINNMYAAFAMDPDVGNAGRNYSSAILPFNMGLAYKADFLEPDWSFPDEIFTAPTFAKAPGFVGVKYLKSPTDLSGNQIGLTMFSNTRNAATAFPDPTGVIQLWRYLSGNVLPAAGDNPCTFQGTQLDKRLCFLDQEAVDTRFYQASGPLTLAPGQSQTIVVAYVHAAPVASAIASSIGGDFKPGIPLSGDSLFLNPAGVRPLERAAGWVSATDTSGDGSIQQGEVTTVPRSLLAKAFVAQTVFDNKFLLPFAPQPPKFFLLPGDNQVTVVWQKSATETDGDPFFALASNPLSPLYDPNFVKRDVEGYRVYRGRTSSQLQLVAQFDYAGTTLIDYTGNFVYPGACAPELGVQTGCPVTFDAVVDTATSPRDTIELVGDIVQVNKVPPGTARVELADGSILVLHADTAVTGEGSGFPPLRDTGVSFAFVDATVKNSFTYYYAVTAFDVNSFQSGPSSLESPRITKIVTPRKTAVNQVAVGPLSTSLLAGAGDTLNRGAANPTINATTGVFSGPAAPTTSFVGTGVTVFADQLIKPNSQAVIRIDSIVPTWYHTAKYYLTAVGAATAAFAFGPVGPLGAEDGTSTLGPAGALVKADSALAVQVGLTGLPFAASAEAELTLHAVTYVSADVDWHVDVDGAFFNTVGFTDVGGSRWFDSTETAADPTLGDAHGTLTGVISMLRPARSHSGVDALFRRFDQTAYHLFRAADIRIYWGATAGKPDSVVDRTHRVRVPFSSQVRASYGFLRDVAGNGIAGPSAAEGILTWTDFLFGPCLPGASGVDNLTGCGGRGFDSVATLMNTDVTGDRASDGSGFGLYINGEPFLFRTNALPVSPAVWTYRSYMGLVSRPSGSYAFQAQPSNPAVPGLRLAITTSTAASYPSTGRADLSNVHTVPDPYYVTNDLEITPTTKVLKFVNLPSQAIIRIYSVSGILVAVVNHNDQSGGGEATWNLRNRNNQFVASGVYFYHVEAPSGASKVGRFTVVNYAQ